MFKGKSQLGNRHVRIDYIFIYLLLFTFNHTKYTLHSIFLRFNPHALWWWSRVLFWAVSHSCGLACQQRVTKTYLGQRSISLKVIRKYDMKKLFITSNAVNTNAAPALKDQSLHFALNRLLKFICFIHAFWTFGS